MTYIHDEDKRHTISHIKMEKNRMSMLSSVLLKHEYYIKSCTLIDLIDRDGR